VRMERGAAGGLPTLPEPSKLVEAFREGGLAALVQTQEQRQLTADMQSAMAIVEGYSEHVMDAMGSELLPDWRELREAMERRRRSRSAPERIIERLLGLNLKMRQYELGRRFCDEVAKRAGIDALNRVWSGPEALPTPSELHRPRDWYVRTSPATAAA
jgi:putative hydrolase